MTTHSHHCDVPGCRESFACTGYPVTHEGGKHCIHEEDPTVFLCPEHQGWEQCPWCGQWYDAQHSYLTHPPACSQACAEKLQPPTDSAKEGAA